MSREGQSLQNEDGNSTASRLPELRIPDEYRSGFARLIRLENGAFQELFSAVRDEPPAISYRELSSRIASKTSIRSAGDVRDILETLDSLYQVRGETNLDVPDFAQVVARAVEEDESLDLPAETRERFVERMTLLLDLDTLEATSKAFDVMNEHEHTIHDARIITDIRPVFGADPKNDPSGALIVHLLKISYHEAEDTKELFVAFSPETIDLLIDDLERAKQKAESLKRILGRAKLPYIAAR